MAKKTNAARLLDAHNIPYELIPYDAGEVELGAVHVAEQIGEPIERVFKTLVLRGDKNGCFVCVVPGDKEVDLKLAAKVSGNKSQRFARTHRLHPWWLFAHRHEKTFSHLHTRHLPAVSVHLRQCRYARFATAHCPRRLGAGGRSRSLCVILIFFFADLTKKV